MKFYRGPSSKPFSDESHEFVSKINSDELEEMIASSARVRFSISKDAVERHAVCTAEFEEADLIPAINGLLRRLKSRQDMVSKLKHILWAPGATDQDRLEALKVALLGR